MAISAPHYEALKELASRGEFTPGGRLLEIGEANWYGDFSISEIAEDIKRLRGDDLGQLLEQRLERAGSSKDQWSAWVIVKIIYDLFIQPWEVQSIDMHGTPDAQKMDLNRPMMTSEPFDVVYNHGTAEHIFNIANVFKIMHDACKVGGLMIHESPFTGWPDHGFFTLQPTLFYDLSAANDYDIRYMAIEHIGHKLLRPVESREEIHELVKAGELPNNAMLYVAIRKTTDEPFKIPTQGVYSNNVSQETIQAWRSLR